MRYLKQDTKKHKKFIKKLSSIICILVITFSSFISVNALSDTYTVVKDNDVYKVNTIKTNPTDIAKKAGIDVKENDKVEFNEEEKVITVKPEFQFDVVDHGTIKTLKLNEGTVQDALNMAGVTLGPKDTVSPSLYSNLNSYTTQVVVESWVDINIVVNKKPCCTVQVPYGTKVLSAIKASNVKFASDDICNLDLNSTLNSDSTIEIKRANANEETLSETIPFETKEIQTDSLEKGHKQVQTQGENGERIINRIVENNPDGSTNITELSNDVTKQPVTQVVLVGTAQASSKNASSSNVKGAPTTYSKVETGVCTAYCDHGRTSTGCSSSVGKVAVNPSDIPYGTRMYICSPDGSYVYGYCIAADTGGAMRAGRARIDLFMNTQAECVAFGRRTMNIYFV